MGYTNPCQAVAISPFGKQAPPGALLGTFMQQAAELRGCITIISVPFKVTPRRSFQMGPTSSHPLAATFRQNKALIRDYGALRVRAPIWNEGVCKSLKASPGAAGERGPGIPYCLSRGHEPFFITEGMIRVRINSHQAGASAD